MDIEKRFDKLEERISEIEKLIRKNQFIIEEKNSDDIEKSIVKKIKEIRTQHLIVIALKLKPQQTRDEIKKTLTEWGKTFGKWFRGGNFNNRLIKENIVKRDGINEDKEDLFSLTKRGELLAEELIEKIRPKK